MDQQFPDLDAPVEAITAAELWARLEAGEAVTVLDTRRPEDVEAWRLVHPNATVVNVPFTAFLTDEEEPVDDVPEGVPDGPLVTSCAKGLSSRYVAEFLHQHGWAVEALQDGMRGWARLYASAELDLDGPAQVVQYHRPASGCLAYLVVAGDEAAVVDPLRAFADRYAEDAEARDAELTYALDTHVHADHVSGLREVARHAGARPTLPTGAVGRGLAFDAYLVDDGDAIPLGDAELEAVALPGHTTEMTGYRVGEVLLAGDTVFAEAVARPDLEAGAEGAPDAARELHDTLGALATRPGRTRIGPGHASPGEAPAPDGTYTVRLDELTDRLRAFSMTREAFVEASLDDVPPRPNNYEAIIATNLGRSAVDDDEAFELELGPNNCAVAAD